jgi:E3 ubiquitin-protein ligase DOA10
VTKEERKLVQDQPLNNQLIDKLEKMYLAQKSATSNNNENSQHQHNENMSQTSEQRRGSQSKSNQIKKNDHVSLVNSSTTPLLRSDNIFIREPGQAMSILLKTKQ